LALTKRFTPKGQADNGGNAGVRPGDCVQFEDEVVEHEKADDNNGEANGNLRIHRPCLARSHRFGEVRSLVCVLFNQNKEADGAVNNVDVVQSQVQCVHCI